VAIEVTDKDLYELLGRKDVEIFNGERIIGNYQAAIEKMKNFTVEMDTLKAAKTSLETSNGQLATKNIQLDQALTTAHKERDAAKGEVANNATALAHANEALNTRETMLDVANAALKKSRDDYTTLQYTCDDMQKEIDALKAKKKSKK
jgi:chromosome segregation ATPase